MTTARHVGAKHGYVITMDMPLSAARDMCRDVALKCGYLIRSDAANCIRIKENKPLTGISIVAAMAFDLIIENHGPSKTVVVVDLGTTALGFKPITTLGAKDHMQSLKSAIQLAYSERMGRAPAKATPAQAPADALISALERLSELRNSGSLTDDEFRAAKAHLLSMP